MEVCQEQHLADETRPVPWGSTCRAREQTQPHYKKGNTYTSSSMQPTCCVGIYMLGSLQGSSISWCLLGELLRKNLVATGEEQQRPQLCLKKQHKKKRKLSIAKSFSSSGKTQPISLQQILGMERIKPNKDS